MSKYVLIESRDPYESLGARETLEIAKTLQEGGHDATVFFLGQAVVAARSGEVSKLLAETRESGVSLLADEFGLRERGIKEVFQVERTSIDYIIDELGRGSKVIWQ